MEALQRRLAFGNANKLLKKQDVVLNTTRTLDDQVHAQRCNRRLHGHTCHLKLVSIEFIDPVVSELR